MLLMSSIVSLYVTQMRSLHAAYLAVHRFRSHVFDVTGADVDFICSMTDKHSLDAVIVNRSIIFLQNYVKCIINMRFYKLTIFTLLSMSCLHLMRLTVGLVDCNYSFTCRQDFVLWCFPKNAHRLKTVQRNTKDHKQTVQNASLQSRQLNKSLFQKDLQNALLTLPNV